MHTKLKLEESTIQGADLTTVGTRSTSSSIPGVEFSLEKEEQLFWEQ